jgi:hypothetical protein
VRSALRRVVAPQPFLANQSSYALRTGSVAGVRNGSVPPVSACGHMGNDSTKHST